MSERPIASRHESATRSGGPWVRWWWPGNALDEAELSVRLREFAAAGFSGVEISPIYGVPGSEARQVPFLSPAFTARVAHTIREASRLGMRVDMILGTGWPFGGARISDSDRARKWHFETQDIDDGSTATVARRLSKPADSTLVAAFARDLSRKTTVPIPIPPATPPDLGAVGWEPPDSNHWQVVSVYLAPTGQKVKRAGPGAEGWVLDHFDPEAISRYLKGFDHFIASLPAPGLRCIFNDSWEVYGADASPYLLKTFPDPAGEPWESLWPRLVPGTDPEDSNPVRRAYREHVGETIRTRFLGALTRWASDRGILVRNQAHGSPGNLIDLYAAVDVPECELFQGAVLRLVGEKPLDGTKAGDEAQALEELLVCRMASSAAKLAGKPFASAEAFTWLGEHGRVPLAHLRTEAAMLFACGIGQLVFHGSMASPPGLPWPGWTFYASTHVSPTTSWWPDLPALNQWIARNQETLRTGTPEADYLVWAPFDDTFRGANTTVLRSCTMHNTAEWLRSGMPGLSDAHRSLDQAGWTYDLVSDRLLGSALHVENGTLLAAMGRWSKLMVPRATAMRPSTILAVDRLLRAGAFVDCVDALPLLDRESTDLDDRVGTAARILETWRKSLPRVVNGVRTTTIGSGTLRVGTLDALLAGAPDGRGSRDAQGAPVRVFWQRRFERGALSAFVVNADSRPTEIVRVRSTRAHRFRSGVIWDPMTDDRHRVDARRIDARTLDIPCVLQPGESRWLLLGNRSALPTARRRASTGPGMLLSGPWSLVPIRGPEPWPAPVRSTTPGDWCAHGRAWADFSGTARYRCPVDLPENDSAWKLDLGDVRHSVRVRVDGREVGVLIAPPYRIAMPANLPRRFVFELDVTNLDANRLAAMDGARIPWKPFFLVNSDYQPFDASGWEPLPSGLLGPVVLRPMQPVEQANGRKPHAR